MKRLLLAVLAGVLSAPAFADDDGSAARGLKYARKNCGECHALAAGATRSPDPKAPPFAVVADTPGMGQLALSVWMQTPHPTMPNIIVQPDDRDDVIAFILSLKGN